MKAPTTIEPTPGRRCSDTRAVLVGSMSSWRLLACLSGRPSTGDPEVSSPNHLAPVSAKEEHIMSVDRTSPAVAETTSEYRPPSAVAGRAAGWIAAVILLSAFAAHAYWLSTGGPAGSEFKPLLPPLLVAALAVTLTLGAAVLLLTRIGVIALRMPRWLLRIGPWALSVIYALAAFQNLFAAATSACAAR